MRKWIFAVLLLALLAVPVCAAETLDFSTSCKSNSGICNNVYAVGASFVDTHGQGYDFMKPGVGVLVLELKGVGNAKVCFTVDNPVEICNGTLRYHYYIARSWGLFNCLTRWDRISVDAKVIEISSKHRACNTDIITLTLANGKKVVVDSNKKRGTYGMWELASQ